MSETFASEDELRAAGWEKMDDSGFSTLVGPFWRAPERPGHRYGFLAVAKHQNRAGFVHGGMLMTFADRAMGTTARDGDPDIRQATVQLNFDFIDGGRIGELIDIRCEVMRRTRTLIFTRGTLTAGGKVVGTTSGIWKIVSRIG